MTTANIRFTRSLIVSASALPMALLLWGCPPPVPTPPPPGFDNTSRLVFPRTTQTIVVDGTTADLNFTDGRMEAAWADGFDYELEQGSPKPDGTLRGVATEDAFYLAVKFNGDPAYDGNDAALLLINPTGAAGNYHRIIVEPCGPTGAGCPGGGGVNLAPTVQYQTGTLSGGSVAWSLPVQNSLPGGIEVKASNVPGGTNNSWAIEMRIPKAALGGFNDNWMGLLVNGIVADLNAETATLYSWPEHSYITGEIDAVGGTGYPQVAKWGVATLSTAFGNGVSPSYYEFGSNQANPSQIALNQPNSFHAWVINNQSSGGQLVAAADVKASFQIANFGIGDDWPDVPVAGNPTAPVTIPAAGAHLFETGLWTLNGTQQGQYSPPHDHQCVRLTLTSTNPDTVILQPTLQKNMDFVTINSPFRSTATLSIGGFEKDMSRDNPRFVLREEFLNLDPELRWDTRLGGADPTAARMWTATIKDGTSRRLDVLVNPDERLTLPSRRAAIKPGSPRPVDVEVEPGSLVTLIVDGSVKLGPVEVGGGGISVGQARSADINLGRRELPQGRSDRIGAVLGSFDGFKTSFVIGNGVSLQVPAGASVLSMMINDTDTGYAMQGGDGFSVQVIPGKVSPWMLTEFPQLAARGRATAAGPVMLPLGVNLPSWIIHATYPTDDFIVINGKRLRIMRPAGSFGYMIRDVGVNRDRTPTPPR